MSLQKSATSAWILDDRRTRYCSVLHATCADCCFARHLRGVIKIGTEVVTLLRRNVHLWVEARRFTNFDERNSRINFSEAWSTAVTKSTPPLDMISYPFSRPFRIILPAFTAICGCFFFWGGEVNKEVVVCRCRWFNSRVLHRKAGRILRRESAVLAVVMAVLFYWHWRL